MCGNGISLFSRDHGIRDCPLSTGHGIRDTGYGSTGYGSTGYRIWEFAYFAGPRHIGYGISHFSRDHGISDMGFRIFRGTTGYHRIWDFAFFAGPRDIGYGISHFARDHGITPNPVQSRGGKKREGPENVNVRLVLRVLSDVQTFQGLVMRISHWGLSGMYVVLKKICGVLRYAHSGMPYPR